MPTLVAANINKSWLSHSKGKRKSSSYQIFGPQKTAFKQLLMLETNTVRKLL